MNINWKEGTTLKIAISSDHGGNNLRKEIMSLLDELQISYEDFGPQTNDSVDYPDYARPVAERVASGEFDRGILICGTGIGISIAANSKQRASVADNVCRYRVGRECGIKQYDS